MGLPSYLLLLLQHLDKGNPLYPALLEQYAMGKPLVDLCLYPYPSLSLALPLPLSM